MIFIGTRGRPKGTQKSPSGTEPVRSVPEKSEKFHCTRCPRKFKTQENNFIKVRSPLYYNNGGHITVCNVCLNEMYEHYISVLNDEQEAVRRICMKFDMYYSPRVFDMMGKSPATASLMRLYISKSNLLHVKGTSFDDTLDEENARTLLEQESFGGVPAEQSGVSKAARERWGLAFEPDEYPMLDAHYKMLTQEIEQMDFVQETLIRDLCVIKIQQNRAIRDQDVDRYDKLTKLYQATLTKANLKVKEKQNVDEESIGAFLSRIEKYAPAEFYADKKKYADYFEIEKYGDRHIYRPLKNLLTGSKERDEEFNVEDDGDA